MTANAQGHTLSDWLSLHELQPSLCREVLIALAQTPGTPAADEPTSEKQALSVDDAWSTVVDAMCCYFPMRRALISETFARSPKIRVERRKAGPQALTLGSNGDYPTIVYSYGDSASDVMVMAHEFAHAVQIVASSGRFVVPIMREVCAFFGEIALLHRLQADNPSWYLALQKVWSADAKKYISSDGRALLTALDSQDPAYQYRWNYPIARYLCIEARAKYSKDRIWMLYEGHLSTRRVLQDCGMHTEFAAGGRRRSCQQGDERIS